MKRNAVFLIHATTWMNLENTVRSKSWSQNTTCCKTPFIYNGYMRQIYGDRKQISDCLGLWEGGCVGRMTSNGYPFGMIKKFNMVIVQFCGKLLKNC